MSSIVVAPSYLALQLSKPRPPFDPASLELNNRNLRTPRQPKSVTSRVEQEIVKAQLSTARATSLFDLYFDASTVGLELSFIPLVLYDAWELRAIFIVHGGQLDRLEEHEQLRCRIIWASAARRWSELKGTPASISPSSRHLLKTCREIADRSSIWRTPTRENIVTLVLLFFATANGDLASHEAQYYLSAACQHLRSLYTIAHPPSSALTGGPDWLPSDRDLAILAPVDEPTYLPPSTFPSSHLVEGSSEVVDHRSHITTHAHITRHALCTARLFANHQAELSRNVTVQQDFAVLDAVWNRLDTLGCAMEEAFALLEATGLEGIGLAVPQTVLGGLWLPPLQTEFAALSYLRDRAEEFGNARSEVVQAHWTAAESLHSNRDGIYLLAARSGYLFSVARLNDFATALSRAKADNLDLFPFGASEKLASLTFFLKSLQNAQRIYNTTVLADSITSLAALRTRLETETGHTGESALSLFDQEARLKLESTGTDGSKVTTEDVFQRLVHRAQGALVRAVSEELVDDSQVFQAIAHDIFAFARSIDGSELLVLERKKAELNCQSLVAKTNLTEHLRVNWQTLDRPLNLPKAPDYTSLYPKISNVSAFWVSLAIRKPRSMTPRAEQLVVTAQFSTAPATKLFDLYFDPSTVGLELSFIPLLLHDPWELRTIFDAHGGQLDRLNENEQLRCRLIWASAARRWAQLDARAPTDAPSPRQLLERCRDDADTLSIWRTPTRTNSITLLLLFLATTDGDLTSKEAQYYLSAACQHLRSIYAPVDSEPGGLEWLPLALALHDALRSLECRVPCSLSDRDFSILSPDGDPTYLAPPSLLASYLLEGSSKVVEYSAQMTLYCVYTARLFAHHQAELSRDVTVQRDFDVLDVVWNRLDALERSMEDAFALISGPGGPNVGGVDFAILQLTFGGSWLPSLQIEFSALMYLRDRLDEFGKVHFRSGPIDHAPGPHRSAVESLYAVAVARSERSLCLFLRYTRNREGISLLAARSGCIFSIGRLNDLAAALYHVKTENADLFPFGMLDKLASLTFFIKSLQNAQRIYNSTVLTDSIVSLNTLRARLEYESGHSGESALSLFTSLTRDGLTTIPDTPSSGFVQTAVMLHRGSKT
ncbi:hypothetical protein JCM16303_000302 [Sporobolomyces ruberrimus]